MQRRVDANQQQLNILLCLQPIRQSIPYRLEEGEQIIGRLINTRSESEGFILDEALRPRKRHLMRHDSKDAPWRSSMTEANQIAILSMLGTAKSVFFC